ncbi:MAG: PAS domain S-box protein [Rhodospirillaceae bacterium]|nr:PAS domain S-box protein [Rhodospirillaceae bacterium]
MAADYAALATRKARYDQVRLIAADGREVLRINWVDGAPRRVPADALQSKIDRPYVRQTLALARGQLYVSRFDLNVERGEIERPLKPTIRFATPVVDAEGKKRGLVIVNYLGQRLLDAIDVADQGARSHFWLVDGAGFWLLGPRPNAEWGFMFPDRRDQSMPNVYPDLWRRIAGSAAGQADIDGDLFTWARFSVADARSGTATAAPGDTRMLYIVARLPAAATAAATAGLRRSFAFIAAGLIVLIAMGSITVAVVSEARHAAVKAIRASEARMRAILEAAPDAVIIADANGRIDFANAQCEKMFGYARGSLIGQAVEVLVPEAVRGRHVGHRSAYVADPLPRPMGAGLELRGRRSDGREIPVEISLSAVPSESGRLIIADIRDVTDKRRKDAEIAALNERLGRDNAALEIVNKELESFSYSVSHDLRAPLRGIDGFSKALVEDYGDKLDAGARGFLDRVRAAAQRMGLLIDDLIKLSRVTRAELAAEPVDLSRLAEEAAELARAAASGRNIEIAIEPGHEAIGDARLLRVALDNLIGNAVKFTAGREQARIAFGRTETDGTTAYYVRDNGVGFDMQYAGKLFGAFQRLHDASAFPGTGIGLATVQRVIHRHGGRVWAESAPDRGTTFYFTL